MRKHNILLLIAFIIFLSCNKDEEQLPNWSKIISKKNGQVWETQAVAFITKMERAPKVSIPATVTNETGYRREVLQFGYIPLELGYHQLLRRVPNSMIDTIYSSYTTLSNDGDVVEDRFVVYDGEENFIDITTIDTVGLKLCGNFQVTFIRDINDPIDNTSLPDTIRFTEGEFYLKIKDIR